LTTNRLARLCLGLGLLFSPFAARGQEAPAAPLRLEEAVELASQNYPAIRAAHAQSAAAATGEEVARNAYLPRVELDWQQTRGTRNNVFGQFFPQPGIPPISGPLLANSSFGESAWGSGGGVLFAWEPFDFGLRRAGVELAGRVTNEARARAAVTQLDVAAAAADAFLRVVAAEQAVRAAGANVERM
jgi:outer membrane protein TolC